MSTLYSRDLADVETSTKPADEDRRGLVYYVIGPSGSGKDSLITALREHYAGDLVVAHRYITRAADAGGENHVALTEDEFAVRHSRNMFLMSWQAHGLHYAIGQEISHWIEGGLSVVVNGSRANLETARRLFGELLVPVVIQVDPEVLEGRLRARGRESEEQIEQRLQRAREFSLDDNEGAFCIDNSGPLEASVQQFVELKRAVEAPAAEVRETA